MWHKGGKREERGTAGIPGPSPRGGVEGVAPPGGLGGAAGGAALGPRGARGRSASRSPAQPSRLPAPGSGSRSSPLGGGGGGGGGNDAEGAPRAERRRLGSRGRGALTNAARCAVAAAAPVSPGTARGGRR